MERKIGETFEFEGRRLNVIEKEGVDDCDGCVFFKEDCNRIRSFVGECEGKERSNNKGVVFVIADEFEEQSEEQAEQPQEEQPKLNLCELLKDCPKGEMFWSPVFGNVWFFDIDKYTKRVKVKTSGVGSWYINADGTITIDKVTSPEIMLYPSREQRDWTKVKYEPKKDLPRTWDEFCKNYERKKGDSYIDLVSKICTSSYDSGFREINHDRNILPSKQAAEAHLAYMQLHQLRDVWREGWVPDWTNELQSKHIIYNYKGELTTMCYSKASRFLSFQDEKRAKEFFECFSGLIKMAGDLI